MPSVGKLSPFLVVHQTAEVQHICVVALGVEAVKDGYEAAAPVSYTHLDVYKRQVPHGGPGGRSGRDPRRGLRHPANTV